MNHTVTGHSLQKIPPSPKLGVIWGPENWLVRELYREPEEQEAIALSLPLTLIWKGFSIACVS